MGWSDKYLKDGSRPSLCRTIYYFEYDDYVAENYYDGHKYWKADSVHDVYDTWQPFNANMQVATRVWRERYGKIELIKNRGNGELAPDLRYFFIVKMSAKDLY